MKIKIALTAISCLLGFAICSPALAQEEPTQITTTTTTTLPPTAVQIISGGILIGATGVMVGGISYDVAFLGGTCASVFGACSTANFAFTTQNSAAAASQALIDQVFLDTAQGTFSSSPGLTNGCSSRTCFVLNPYGISNGLAGSNVQSTAVVNGGLNISVATNFVRPTSFDTTSDPDITFSRFTLSPITPPVVTPVAGAVPEPATWAMMMLGFGGMGYTMRRKAKVSTRIRFA